MPVLVEAISVIIRIQSIRDKYPGGWEDFVRKVPNRTLCNDDELARVGFMSPNDCESFVQSLNSAGLVYLKDDTCQDIAVADQQRGCYHECFGRNLHVLK
jgi:hypothetical protein